jgi:hypothetical protein
MVGEWPLPVKRPRGAVSTEVRAFLRKKREKTCIRTLGTSTSTVVS